METGRTCFSLHMHIKHYYLSDTPIYGKQGHLCILQNVFILIINDNYSLQTVLLNYMHERNCFSVTAPFFSSKKSSKKQAICCWPTCSYSLYYILITFYFYYQRI